MQATANGNIDSERTPLKMNTEKKTKFCKENFIGLKYFSKKLQRYYKVETMLTSSDQTQPQKYLSNQLLHRKIPCGILDNYNCRVQLFKKTATHHNSQKNH